MNFKKFPLRLESYLFEPINWNTALQSFNSIAPFMSRTDWQSAGYNIDRSYQRLPHNLYVQQEDERGYLRRSVKFFQSLQKMVSQEASYGYARPRTILIVGHSASPIIFPTIAKNERFDLSTFNQKCGSSQFLDTAVLERNAATKQWQQTGEIRPALSEISLKS